MSENDICVYAYDGKKSTSNQFYWNMLYSEWMFSRTVFSIQQLILTKPVLGEPSHLGAEQLAYRQLKLLKSKHFSLSELKSCLAIFTNNMVL